MKYITFCPAGIFVLDEDKKIIDFSLFQKDPEVIFDRLKKLESGKLVPELNDVLERIEDKDIVTDIPIRLKDRNIQEMKIKKDCRALALESGFVKNNAEYNKILSEVQILRTKEKMKSGEKLDKVVMQVVSAIDDLTDISNRFSERLHEWYGLYYPELERKVKDNERYAKIISEDPERKEESIGTDLSEEDLLQIKNYATKTKEIFELKKDLEKYLEDLMDRVAPNVSAVAGPVLGAKLILLAGGLEKLAKLPSSTVQLLGAEKALFRFMRSKKKGKPPKYGILFLHPEVTNAPPDLKGKVARIVASVISIASKTDFYTKENKSETYKKELERRLKEVYEKR
ncbi:MAG: hypothetical protein J7L45_02330 [Candidatus Aenigmarchaeota archaeon]|nr:hypothetical protein [Candidatus Aenigmarchaeota archaeon]